MTIEELMQEIVDDLTVELKDEDNFDADILGVKVKSAIREVKDARRYPVNYPDTLIVADLERHYSIIKDMALYDYTKVGAEGQTSYSADGENIAYEERRRLFAGVNPICVVF